MHRRAFVLILVPFLAIAGCRHNHSTVQPMSETVMVYVTNGFTQPMEIYVEASGAQQRLGTVNPGTEGRFRIPPGLIGSGLVGFLAHPMVPFRQDQEARPGQLLLVRGQVVEFNIANPLFNSTITVRE